MFGINKKVNVNDKIAHSNCLGELAKLNHTYWKFTQSSQGMSHEANVYACYDKEGEFVNAQDPDNGLSLSQNEPLLDVICMGINSQNYVSIVQIQSFKKYSIFHINTLVEL